VLEADLIMLKFWERLRKGPKAATAGGGAVADPGSTHKDADAIHASFLSLLLGGSRLHREEALTTPEKLVGQAVEQLLRNSEQRAAAVPRLPTLLPLLLKQLRDPLASSRDYASLILQDPLISPTVLRVANSVYFNPYRKSLDNFERVVADLGVIKLRMVLSAAVMQPVLLGPADSLPQKVWKHSLACAAICQSLAPRDNVDPYLAYLTGLIHDIGVVTLYNQVQQMHREYLDGAQTGRALLHGLIEKWAKQLAVWIAQDWQFPPEVIQALAAQDDPAQDTALGRVLRRANAICEAHDVYRAELIERRAFEQIATRLRIPAPMLQALENGD
jgi:HD-like signal output (HDOD) protein